MAKGQIVSHVASVSVTGTVFLKSCEKKTENTVGKARRVKDHGAAGAYTSRFKALDKDLQEIRDILKSASITQEELLGLQRKINDIAEQTAQTTDELDGLDDDIADVRQSILQAQANLEYLKEDSDQLTQDAQIMKDDITALQETNVEGALNLTKEARERSQKAAQQVEQIQATNGPLEESKANRERTNMLMKHSGGTYKQTQDEDQQTLQDVAQKIRDLEYEIPGLNKKVCDGKTTVDQPCDELCGGAGCDKCGGLSCLNGALSRADEAVKAANNADALLIEKDGKAEDVLNDVRRAQQISLSASNEAQIAYDSANTAKERSIQELEEVTSLNSKITDFLDKDRAQPADVKRAAEECLALELRLDDSTISDIATEINNAIENVADVEGILGDTRADLSRVETLLTTAKEAEQFAGGELEKANKVTDDLSKALEAQNKADVSIQTTQTKIDSARKDLAQIANDMDQATNAADASVDDVRDLTERQTLLQTEYIKNENRVNAAEAAKDAKAKANQANNDLYLLNTGFKNVTDTLQEKTVTVTGAKDMAMDLQKRANALSNSATNKIANLKDIESEFESNERKLMSLSQELVKLNCEMKIHLKVIDEKSNYYRTCATGGTWEPQETCSCIDGNLEPSCTSAQGGSQAMMDQPYAISS
jgi:coxsackievirus/adenovirus receptor